MNASPSPIFDFLSHILRSLIKSHPPHPGPGGRGGGGYGTLYAPDNIFVAPEKKSCSSLSTHTEHWSLGKRIIALSAGGFKVLDELRFYLYFIA